MTREITHMKAFAAALESMKKPAFTIGKIAPTPGLVNQFFNDSTGRATKAKSTPAGPGMRAATGSLSPRRRCPRPTAGRNADQDRELAADSAGGLQRPPAGRA